MNRKHGAFVRFVLLVIVTALIGAACGSGSDDGEGASGARDDGKPVAGGRFTLLVPSAIAGDLNPIKRPPPIADQAIFGQLAVQKAGGGVEMRLAESLESTDGKVWTLKLRSGLVFSDGSPYDANAVKFTWDQLADPANASFNGPAAKRIEKSEVVDATTLRITLRQVNPSFPIDVSGPLTAVVPPDAYQRLGAAKFGTEPVGAGPYQVKQWVRDGDLTLVRNPKYTGTTYVDEIVIRPVLDADQIVNTFVAGEADAFQSIDAKTPQRMKERGVEMATAKPNGGVALLFNTKIAPFKDNLDARRALAMAIDGTAMSRALYGGTLPTATNPFDDSSPFHDKSIEYVAPNAERAQELFDKLARDNGGKPLELTLLVPQIHADKGDWISASMARFKNVTVKLEQVTTPQFVPSIRSGRGNVALAPATWFDPDPALADYLKTGATFNYYGQTFSAELDQAVAAAQSTFDRAKRIEAWKDVQRIVARDVPLAWTVAQEFYFPKAEHVGGLTDDSLLVIGAQVVPDFTKVFRRP